MDLRLALLLLGLFIVAIVALSAYDKVRFGRRPRMKVAPPVLGESPLDTPEAEDEDTGPGVLASARAGSSRRDEARAAEREPDFDIALQGKIWNESAVQDFQFMPDEKIDLIISVPGTATAMRDDVLRLYKDKEGLFSKPHKVYGLRQPMRLWANMERDPPQSQYSDIALTLQLVDHEGPVGETELKDFSQLGLNLADTLQRPLKFSQSLDDAVPRAQVLHRFCEAYDVFASVNVIAKSTLGFSGRAIEQAAMRCGFQFGELGIFHARNPGTVGSRNLYSLANLFKPGSFDLTKLDGFRTPGVAVFMNVPCVHEPVHAFDKMVDAARSLARHLDGELLDHERRYLTDQGLAVIRAQIDRIAKGMEAEGIAPGTQTARRLFNT